MKLAVMQPYFAPYIGYFQLMMSVDRFVLLDDVNFINRGWINRNRILVGGREHLFTLPLQGASQNRLIRQISLCPDVPWRARLLKTIEQSYRRAPFFQETLPLVRDILLCEEAELSAYLHASLMRFAGWLDIPAQIVPSSSVYEDTGRRGAQRILQICELERAHTYVNPPGGKALYRAEDFDAVGVRLRFLKPRLDPYPQGGATFTPGLSIIDVLMWNGRAATAAALRMAELE